MSPPAADGMEQMTGGCRQLPSIPILQCRWGLGEGVSPMVFKPLAIPRHLLRAPDEPPPEPLRRLRGRGRAAGLSSHDDPLPVPGELTNVGVSNLSIREQINRVRDNLPIYETPINYSQYILPRRASLDDDEAPEQESPAAAPPPRQVVSQLTAGPSRRGGWAEVMDPGGQVTAVDSALLPQNMSGGGDAAPATSRHLPRYYPYQDDDCDDLDVLEERTNSSDMSNEYERPRAWRPRPPPLNEQSFPPLPGAAAAPAPARPADRVPDRSPSKSDRSPSGPRLAAAGGDGPAAQPKKRRGRQGRKKPTAPDPPATGPLAASAASPPWTSAPTSSQASDDSVTVSAGGAPAPPAEETPSGQVHVTGVTDSNWEEVQQYVRQYGNVEQPRRGSDDDGWFNVSPAENAGWIVSVHSGTPCDIAGVVFHLADDEAARPAPPASR